MAQSWRTRARDAPARRPADVVPAREQELQEQAKVYEDEVKLFDKIIKDEKEHTVWRVSTYLFAVLIVLSAAASAPSAADLELYMRDLRLASQPPQAAQRLGRLSDRLRQPPWSFAQAWRALIQAAAWEWGNVTRHDSWGVLCIADVTPRVTPGDPVPEPWVLLGAWTRWVPLPRKLHRTTGLLFAAALAAALAGPLNGEVWRRRNMLLDWRNIFRRPWSAFASLLAVRRGDAIDAVHCLVALPLAAASLESRPELEPMVLPLFVIYGAAAGVIALSAFLFQAGGGSVHPAEKGSGWGLLPAAVLGLQWTDVIYLVRTGQQPLWAQFSADWTALVRLRKPAPAQLLVMSTAFETYNARRAFHLLVPHIAAVSVSIILTNVLFAMGVPAPSAGPQYA